MAKARYDAVNKLKMDGRDLERQYRKIRGVRNAKNDPEETIRGKVKAGAFAI